MTLEELIEEGERLSKPSLLLVDSIEQSGIAGYWHGGEPLTDGTARRLWLTLDCTWLSRHGSRLRDGVMCIYEHISKSGEQQGRVTYTPNQNLSTLTVEGLPLYGIEAESFPPIQAVCLYGSEHVEQWVESLGLSRRDYDAVEQTPLGEAYQNIWLARSPLGNNKESIVAVMGGWHMLWPDDDFYMPPEINLIVWTFRNAEPYIEVWERLPNFRVYFRIT
jgi:hypothetical protein